MLWILINLVLSGWLHQHIYNWRKQSLVLYCFYIIIILTYSQKFMLGILRDIDKCQVINQLNEICQTPNLNHKTKQGRKKSKKYIWIKNHWRFIQSSLHNSLLLNQEWAWRKKKKQSLKTEHNFNLPDEQIYLTKE